MEPAGRFREEYIQIIRVRFIDKMTSQNVRLGRESYFKIIRQTSASGRKPSVRSFPMP
ncbi:MAG: hypothetical protein ACI9Y1_002213 [Lentisphaeria bacterium]|jgi:hypothetical protein